jgi:uncharacterized protein
MCHKPTSRRQTLSKTSISSKQPDMRPIPGPTLAPARRPPSKSPVHVVFTESLKEARWTPEVGTLLDLAEFQGLIPDFGCQEGHCGACRTKVLAGAVTYRHASR